MQKPSNTNFLKAYGKFNFQPYPGEKRALLHNTRFLKHNVNRELHKSARFFKEHNRSDLESHLGLQTLPCSKNLRGKH